MSHYPSHSQLNTRKFGRRIWYFIRSHFRLFSRHPCNCNYRHVLLIETVLGWLVWFFVFYWEKTKFSVGLVDQLRHNQHKTRLNWLIDKPWGASTVIYIPGQLEMAAGSSLILVTLLVNNKERHGELLFVWQEEYMEVIRFIVSRLCSNI